MTKNMNKIEKLIAELCPDGVEFKKLGEVISLEYGKPLKESERGGGNFPVLGSNGRIGFHGSYLIEGPCLIVGRKGSAGAVVWEDQNCYPIDTTFFVKKQNDEILLKYLFHLFQTLNLTADKQDGGVPGLNRNNVYKIKIPIPPLPVQEEIVKILDTFTTLEAELEAELEARKKQYEYYRDELLTFGAEVEWKTLGEVATLITKGTTPKNFTNSGINFVKLESFEGGKINPAKFAFVHEQTHCKELKRSILKEHDILFAIAGATIGKCAIVEESILPANTNQALAIVRLGTGVKVRFIFHYMQTIAMVKYIVKYNKTSAQPNLNLQQISNFPVPIPTIAEQERIVAILDKFDALVHDLPAPSADGWRQAGISVGLPAEIAARRKQYEYYREKLLTFQEKQ